jgi:hypothetical protein
VVTIAITLIPRGFLTDLGGPVRGQAYQDFMWLRAGNRFDPATSWPTVFEREDVSNGSICGIAGNAPPGSAVYAPIVW